MAFIAAAGNPVYDSIVTPRSTTGGRVLSGCSTNGCIALARLGHRAALIGSIGPDYLAAFERDAQRLGITPYLQLGAATGGFSLNYDERGDRTLDVLGVADAALVQPPAQHRHDVMARHMRAERRVIRPNIPYMQIMEPRHARQRGDKFANFLDIYVPRDGIHQLHDRFREQ